MYLANILTIVTIGLCASATTVSYDTGYDDASRSLDVVSCSDGANGLITRYGWLTQGAIPTYPSIGGSDTIAGWNSPNCGTCYSLSYQGNTIYVLAIDHAGAGFNIAEAAMNTLTNNQAIQLGRIEADAVEVGLSFCSVS